MKSSLRSMSALISAADFEGWKVAFVLSFPLIQVCIPSRMKHHHLTAAFFDVVVQYYGLHV